MSCEYCGDTLPEDHWVHTTEDGEERVFCSEACIDKWLAAPTLDEELRELTQQWRERASELFHDENSLCELQRSDELHKCADELEALLDEEPKDCGQYHPLPCGVDKDCADLEDD